MKREVLIYVVFPKHGCRVPVYKGDTNALTKMPWLVDKVDCYLADHKGIRFPNQGRWSD